LETADSQLPTYASLVICGYLRERCYLQTVFPKCFPAWCTWEWSSKLKALQPGNYQLTRNS